MLKTSNPTLIPTVFEQERALGSEETMTIQGTINKCFILFGLLILSASWIWNRLSLSPSVLGNQDYQVSQISHAMPYVVGGSILGFIFAIITVFKRSVSQYTAPVYAICEGLVLGGISAIFELTYPGIVIQAVALTFGTLFCMLGLYKTKIIKVTDKFMIGLASATGAICLVYLVNFVLRFFGRELPFIYSNGAFGIGFSVVVCAIAALNLILDFYVIEQVAEQGSKKYMEWYGAFSLMVTLIWLYLEILRLLSKMRSRR